MTHDEVNICSLPCYISDQNPLSLKLRPPDGYLTGSSTYSLAFSCLSMPQFALAKRLPLVVLA